MTIYMRKIIFLWTILIALSIHAYADEKVSFTASAPEAVAVGDQFRLSFTANTLNVKDLQIPSLKGFDVLMGPSRSTNISSINGNTTQSITFTYMLLAKEEGTYTIPGATILVGGKQVISNGVTVKVLPADQTSANAGSRQGGGANAASSNSNSVSNTDLFITATANKTTVYEQEAILLTYKIYSVVDLQGFESARMPDFKGFHSQEVELGDNRKWVLEHYRGRNYQTAVYRQFVLFPQQSGQLTIEPARLEASVLKVNRAVDPFEAFFNGGSNYMKIKKTIQTPKLTIDVKALPTGKPMDFSGGVGEFNISSSINTTELKTNDAITLKIIISGTGNLKLTGNPEVKFPEDFEVYDPKVDNQFRLTGAGLSGNKVIEYLAIPRNAGTYKIPPVTFSYFDIKTQSYKTLSTEGYELHVEKGTGNAAQTVANFTSKEDLKVLNEDIRFIKQGDVSLKPKGDFFFGSTACWLGYLIPLCIFLAVFVYYRKQIAANANVSQMRTKKANKVAVKRMKLAGKLLAENKKDAFYDEVLKALWGYVSDKLSIPVSRLSKDNIEETLRNHNVDTVLIDEFLATLNNCEFARFAPGDDNQAMDKVYTDSLEVIGRMENSIKH